MTRGGVVILVPYRPSGDRHRWLWDMVRPELERFGWPIVTGTCEGRWSRAPAVNDAARRAGDWDVAFIADCDTIPDHDGIRRAVQWVQSTGGGVRPHDQRYMLTQQQTLRAVQRGVESIPVRELKAPWAGGGLDVVTREAWDRVAATNDSPGAFDESYTGWGYEDSQWHVDLLVTSYWDRLPGVAYHLWHETHDNKPNPESVQRFRHTQRKHKDAIDAWAATKGLRKPLAVF